MMMMGVVVVVMAEVSNQKHRAALVAKGQIYVLPTSPGVEKSFLCTQIDSGVVVFRTHHGVCGPVVCTHAHAQVLFRARSSKTHSQNDAPRQDGCVVAESSRSAFVAHRTEVPHASDWVRPSVPPSVRSIDAFCTHSHWQSAPFFSLTCCGGCSIWRVSRAGVEAAQAAG